MNGEVAAGRAGRLGAVEAGAGVPVSVAARTVAADVAGRVAGVVVTDGAACVGGRVATVGRVVEPVLQAKTVSRITNPPKQDFRLMGRHKGSFY
jgi:hypothetical protein